ncbi:hypothetical protein LOTGIDRAFT_172967 [Lottia gigantea]|uniref:Flavin-containing monooxygenase n=1 Tax=Lottia gigantea TaxID=225164 RepID=V4CFR5_LOTGI|nr:hypothetical protein LOTGIDRAFT_172967 [Lottia gigantea]ESP00865.1 hypothetical protein LOTGIDRAFT_172967 [Lottia gigantea]
MSSPIKKDAVIIGAGISGLAAAKCLKDDGFDVVILERTGEVGGLWTFRENDYGVMRFTHINVSKYNYCFSDFPFPENVGDYPHNSDMAKYIYDYTTHFKLDQIIQFNTKVVSLEKKGDEWEVITVRMEDDGQTGTETNDKQVYIAKYVAIATGHHAEPTFPEFKGQETFKGEIIHSVKYKDCITNGMVGKRVLVVGIGNSAVDIATECASAGRCKSVFITTRSGAWVVPNYIFGYPTDTYACRAFFLLPWKWANFIFENIIKLVSASPRRWGLNPKMKALQTQPTVSPTLIHHIQRQQIKIVPNILRVEGSRVEFVDGQSAEFDVIILCTGYKISLPYLQKTIRDKVLEEESNTIRLYKNVFSPDIGSSLAFIGFVQPASGGVLTMSEIQARWFSALCHGSVRLPSKQIMLESMKEEKMAYSERYYRSNRHTIQKDPIVYNDDIASMIGAKPNILKHPSLAWRLMLSSCGAYQWRLQGPNKWSGSEEAVRKVPLTELMNYSAIVLLFIIGLLLIFFLRFFYKIVDFIF